MLQARAPSLRSHDFARAKRSVELVRGKLRTGDCSASGAGGGNRSPGSCRQIATARHDAKPIAARVTARQRFGAYADAIALLLHAVRRSPRQCIREGCKEKGPHLAQQCRSHLELDWPDLVAA